MKTDIYGTHAVQIHIYYLSKVSQPVCEIQVTYPYFTKDKIELREVCTCPGLRSWKMAEPVFEPRCVTLKIQILSIYHADKVKFNAGSSQLLMLSCPIHCKCVGDIQKDNPCSWALLFLKTTRVLAGVGIMWHPRFLSPQHLLLSHCFRATQLFLVLLTGLLSKKLPPNLAASVRSVAKFIPWYFTVMQLVFHENSAQNSSVLAQSKVGVLDWYIPLIHPPQILNGNVHLLNKLLYCLGRNEKIIVFVLTL